MKGKRRKVEPLPLRMDLPEELAALAVPEDDHQEATVILNSSEQGAATWRDLRLGVLIPAFLGLAADKLAEWWAANNRLATAVVGVTAGTTLAYSGFSVVLDGNGQPVTLPRPPTVTVTMTRPAPTWTPEPTATRTKPTPAAAITTPPNDPIASEQPEALPTSPAASPSSTPSARTPVVTPTSTTPAPQERPTTRETTSAPTPTSAPDVTTPPPTTSAPEPTISTMQDCVLRADIDPLLDLCVLG